MRSPRSCWRRAIPQTRPTLPQWVRACDLAGGCELRRGARWVLVASPGDVEVATAAAVAEAEVLEKWYGSPVGRHRKTGNDFATDADIEAEVAVREIVHTARPNDGFVGEELGASAPADRTWLVDPLCGTLNLAAQTPLMASMWRCEPALPSPRPSRQTPWPGRSSGPTATPPGCATTSPMCGSLRRRTPRRSISTSTPRPGRRISSRRCEMLSETSGGTGSWRVWNASIRVQCRSIRRAARAAMAAAATGTTSAARRLVAVASTPTSIGPVRLPR